MSNISVINKLIEIDNLFIDYCYLFNEINKISKSYTFPKFILNNLNYNEINNNIEILKLCECCKRHTKKEYCLELQKPSNYLNVKSNECCCKCRHYIRYLECSLKYLK